MTKCDKMTETFLIRAAQPNDLDDVDALLRRSYPALLKESYPPSTYVTAIPLIAKAQPRLLATGTYFVVLDGETIVGAGGWTRGAPTGGRQALRDVGHIRHVVTDHQRVRQGIGRRLMSHVVATAQEAGIRELECLSTLMAVPFYEALGFRQLGPVTLNLRAGVTFPAVQMLRQLQSASR